MRSGSVMLGFLAVPCHLLSATCLCGCADTDFPTARSLMQRDHTQAGVSVWPRKLLDQQHHDHVYQVSKTRLTFVRANG